MIVIEGPDHVGKTHLAHELIRRLNARGYPHIYQHLSKLPESFHYFRDYLPLINKNVVMDRFLPSRQAYGKVFDNQRMLDDDEFKLMDACLRLVGAVTVLVTADPVWLREHFGEKDEMYEVGPVLQVNDVYKDQASNGVWDVDFTFETSAAAGFPSSDEAWLDAIVDKYGARRGMIERLL